ncbi:hypothetical protein Nepgr_014556 [Nepenthes gracilis]|uniref:Uncharacterized protein n=1 Tax=Nepenthes gracilis TaxID=150966 RepID=A0AAD3SL18_NEPGR|nr:hypothetical protein Nepgr_014556 [Nepenthes gracilis]
MCSWKEQIPHETELRFRDLDSLSRHEQGGAEEWRLQGTVRPIWEGIPGTAIEGFESYVDGGGKRGSGAINGIWCCSTSPVSLELGQGGQGAAFEAFGF